MHGIRGNRGQYLFQRDHESLPLTGIEHGNGITKNPAAGLQHLSRHGSPLVSEDHSNRTAVTTCLPLRVALRHELINDTYRGRLRPAKRPPELLDSQARLLRKNRQPSAQSTRMPGRGFHSRGQRVGHRDDQRTQQILQTTAHDNK